jgi:hypothetical protein
MLLAPATTTCGTFELSLDLWPDRASAGLAEPPAGVPVLLLQDGALGSFFLSEQLPWSSLPDFACHIRGDWLRPRLEGASGHAVEAGGVG